MEMSRKDYKFLVGAIAFAFVITVCLYSCGGTKSLATTSKTSIPYTTPEHLELKPVKQDTVKPKPQRIPTEQEKAFTKKLNFVLDNSGKTFEDVSAIRGDIKHLTDVILTRATELRISNDSLRNMLFNSDRKQNDLLVLLLKESKARIANEKKTEEDRKQNIANTNAQNLYTSIGFIGLVVLLFILLLMWLDVRRIKAKVKLSTHNV